MARTRIRHVSVNGFEHNRDAGGLEENVFYVLPKQVAYCRDGFVCYWYDTLQEALDKHA